MPFVALLIGIVLILVIVGVALMFGLAGAVRRGPRPNEGEKSAHGPPGGADSAI